MDCDAAVPLTVVSAGVGALAVLAALGPIAFLLAFGFTGISGVITPVFLVLAGLGLSRDRE